MTITRHCAERFIERAKWKSTDIEGAKAKILEMIGKAEPVTLKPQYRATQLLRDELRATSYLRFANWIFALDESGNVMTCYTASKLRWVRS